MKGRSNSRRRAIVDLFQCGWSPRDIARLLKVTKHDVEQELRKAFRR